MSVNINKDDDAVIEPKFDQILEAKRLFTKGLSIKSKNLFSQEAFDLFQRANDLDPYFIDAWIELTKCHEQKKDIESAVRCLEGALERCDPAKPNKIILRKLSTLIRQQVGKNCDSLEERIAALLRSLDLSKQALKTDLDDAQSYYNLAKAYMCLFFATECVDQQLINLSKASFVKALDLSNEQIGKRETAKGNKIVLSKGNPKVNEAILNQEDIERPYIEQSDFLFNYSSVLIYLQEFEKALEYLRLATKWDADWDEPKLLEKCLVDYLKQVHSMVHDLSKSNKRMLKRYSKVVDSLRNVEKFEKIIQFDQCRLLKSQDICLRSCTIKDLENMQCKDETKTHETNATSSPGSAKEVKLLHLRLVNTVYYNQAMYLTFVAIDQDNSLIVVTIYNLAESRSPTAKDLVTIVEPKIEQISVDNLATGGKDCKICYERINVREFKSLYVNGCRITIDQVSKPQFKVSLLP